jgi:hypothetical protein
MEFKVYLVSMSRDVQNTAALISCDPAPPPLPPAFGLVYEGAIGQSVLWIRIGFIAVPDPPLYLNEDPDQNPGKKNQCGPM